MNKLLLTVASLALISGAAGCAHNALVGHESQRGGRFYGDYGIKGNNNTITIQKGSRITKLSFWGDGNTATVEDGVTLQHVEFFGSNNTVSVPGFLTFRVTQVGQNNQVVRRPMPMWETGSMDDFYAAPDVGPPPAMSPAEEMAPPGEAQPQTQPPPPGEEGGLEPAEGDWREPRQEPGGGSQP